jgi:hypothetical protein
VLGPAGHQRGRAGGDPDHEHRGCALAGRLGPREQLTALIDEVDHVHELREDQQRRSHQSGHRRDRQGVGAKLTPDERSDGAAAGREPGQHAFQTGLDGLSTRPFRPSFRPLSGAQRSANIGQSPQRSYIR